MKQVYYTQCPLGYGLGATNGFQVKRLDPGYPTGGDFRHLGLRAFLPGTRTLAPPALRYRRDGSTVEIAWLTPRTHEYETENSRLWGRPGGQFAHGLRLDADELAALANWPAGLHSAPFWKRTDPERTAGQPPEPVVLTRNDLFWTPDIANGVEIARAIGPDRLAELLTALARASSTSRCIYLVARPDQLGPLVGLLTLALPERLRLDVAFSTYHDRPEELTGFVLQGTLAEARPNRALLANLGTIADLDRGRLEPPCEPASWARGLAAWCCDGTSASSAAWARTSERVNRMKALPPGAERWSDSWLDSLYDLEARTRIPLTAPTSPSGWRREADLARFAASAGLAEEWLGAHPAAWWLQIAESSSELLAEGAAAASLHARMGVSVQRQTASRGSFPSGSPAEWGQVVARWFHDADQELLDRASATALKASAPELRGMILAAIVRDSSPARGQAVIERLRQDPAFDPALLLPVEASRCASTLFGGFPSPGLDRVLREILETPEAVVSAFSAITSVLRDDEPGRMQLSRALAETLEQAAPPGWSLAWHWCLADDLAGSWLSAYLDRLASQPDFPTRRTELVDSTRPDARPALARVWLSGFAQEHSQEAFVWGVEELLMSLDPSQRPVDPSWPALYVARASGLQLARKLYGKATRRGELYAWLSEAHRRGELDELSRARLKTARAFASLLDTGSTQSLTSAALPDAEPSERGELLRWIWASSPDHSSSQASLIVQRVREEWGCDAFLSESPGLEGIAAALAEMLHDLRDEPDEWIPALLQLVHLAETTDPLRRGAASLAALTTQAALADREWNEPGRWSLRNALLAHDQAWPALVLDVARGCPPGGHRGFFAWFEAWDLGLERGSRERETRFAELMLNAARDPSRLVALVETLAHALPDLERIESWPASGSTDSGPDMRETFALRAPLMPLSAAALPSLRRWMKRNYGSAGPSFDLNAADLLPESPESGPTPNPSAPRELADAAWNRWLCLDALSVLGRPGTGLMDQWHTILAWCQDGLPLDRLDPQERYAFLARVILLLGGYDPNELSHQRNLQRLARWLVDNGCRQSGRIHAWARDLQGERTSESVIREKKPLVQNLCRELDEETERTARKSANSP